MPTIVIDGLYFASTHQDLNRRICMLSRAEKVGKIWLHPVSVEYNRGPPSRIEPDFKSTAPGKNLDTMGRLEVLISPDKKTVTNKRSVLTTTCYMSAAE